MSMFKPLLILDSVDKTANILGAHVGLKISNTFSLVMLCLHSSGKCKQNCCPDFCVAFAVVFALICLLLLLFANLFLVCA